jgi:hypothetical protein
VDSIRRELEESRRRNNELESRVLDLTTQLNQREKDSDEAQQQLRFQEFQNESLTKGSNSKNEQQAQEIKDKILELKAKT